MYLFFSMSSFHCQFPAVIFLALFCSPSPSFQWSTAVQNTCRQAHPYEISLHPSRHCTNHPAGHGQNNSCTTAAKRRITGAPSTLVKSKTRCFTLVLYICFTRYHSPRQLLCQALHAWMQPSNSVASAALRILPGTCALKCLPQVSQAPTMAVQMLTFEGLCPRCSWKHEFSVRVYYSRTWCL